jgi:hypothetical protein
LIATPNVDNANRRQKKAKAKLQATCISYVERNSSIRFANYLDDVLIWNYAMSGFKRGIEKVGMGFVPTCIHVLNSLKFRLLRKTLFHAKFTINYGTTLKSSGSPWEWTNHK